MHRRHANQRNIWKISTLGIILILSCFIVYAEEEIVMPNHLLHISIKGTDTISVEDTWVTFNRERYVFPVYRFAEEFKMSICENKYYYEVETPNGSVYWNYFCPKGILTWDGALTTEEDINFKQDTTDLVLPFFDEAENIEILDKDGNVALSIPLTIYQKSKTEFRVKEAPVALEEPSMNIIEETEIIEEPAPAEEVQVTPVEEAPELDEIAMLQIAGGLLLLVILIAIFIVRIKNAR